MNEQEVEIKFSLAQINVILQRLGQLPYAQVADLVEGIKAIATPQIPPPVESEDADTKSDE